MNQILKKSAFVFTLLTTCLGLQAQDSWTLEKCINYARDNNISVKQADANIKTALISEKQARASRLPNVSANTGFSEQFGYTIDPTTNSFSNQAIGANSLSLNAGVTLFSGGQIYHSIKKAGLDAKAAAADAEQTVNSLGLQIASAYLNILLFEEQAGSALQRVEQSKKQLEVTLKLIDAGSQPQAERYTIEAQIAREEQTSIVARNNVDLAYLSLKQLLQLEPDFDLRIERPTVLIPSDVNPDIVALTPVYNTALSTQPSITAADFRIKSAEADEAIARAAYYPTVTLGANLSSYYSTQSKEAVFTGNILPGATQIVNVGGTNVPVTFYRDEFYLNQVPYLTQIDRNFGQGIDVRVQIPIYQNGRVRLSVERARLGIITSQLQNNQTRQQLKNDIQTAIANARSARLQLAAAQKSIDANRIAYSNTEKRHNLGAANTLELTTAKTNLAIAENDLIVAKYDYLFRLKILDFYQGKPLKLD